MANPIIVNNLLCTVESLSLFYLLFSPWFIYLYIYIYSEGYSATTEPMDAVNILPLARFEPTTSATPPSTIPGTDATNCATETSPRKDVQEALILTMTDAVHVVYWFLSISFASESLMDPRIQVKLDKYQKCGNIISQTSLLSRWSINKLGI